VAVRHLKELTDGNVFVDASIKCLTRVLAALPALAANDKRLANWTQEPLLQVRDELDGIVEDDMLDIHDPSGQICTTARMLGTTVGFMTADALFRLMALLCGCLSLSRALTVNNVFIVARTNFGASKTPSCFALRPQALPHQRWKMNESG